MRPFSFLNLCWRVLLLVGLVSGCNSGSSNSSSSSSSSSAIAKGIWSGTDSTSGQIVVGLINSAGQADFIRGDGVQFIGTVQISGNTLASTVNGYAEFGYTLPDGSSTGLGTLNATVITSTSIVGTLTFTSNIGTSYPGSWSLSYQTLSTTGSSLAAIAGAYTELSSVKNNNTGGKLTISTGGAVTSSGAASGCTMNGSIGIGDSSTDIYEISFTYSGCTGQWASLNDVPFTGLALVNTTQSPSQLLIGVSGQTSTGTKYGLVNTLSLN